MSFIFWNEHVFFNFFFGTALPESNARAHLKQEKKHSGLNMEDTPAMH